MALVTKMALADAQVKPEEVEVLEEFTSLFGGDMRIPPDEIYGPTNVDAFDSHESRIIALLGMLVVAYSDNHFHIDESAVIVDTAKAFGIDDAVLLEMKSWAQRSAALYAEFLEIAASR